MPEEKEKQDPAWSEDLTWDYFKKLLSEIQSKYLLLGFSQVPLALATKKQTLVLRHDVDLCLDYALEMAKIESAMGIVATYMVLTDSEMYDITKPDSQEKIKQLIALGHEIGLHFDYTSEDKAEEQIDEARKKLESVTGSPVKSISFHRPLEKFLRGPLEIQGMVNAYSAELMQRYWSDSKGRFREGEPIPMLKESKAKLVQLGIHPIWWADTSTKPENRLQSFFEKTIEEFTEKFDTALGNQLSIKRSGEQFREGLTNEK